MNIVTLVKGWWARRREYARARMFCSRWKLAHGWSANDRGCGVVKSGGPHAPGDWWLTATTTERGTFETIVDQWFKGSERDAWIALARTLKESA